MLASIDHAENCCREIIALTQQNEVCSRVRWKFGISDVEYSYRSLGGRLRFFWRYILT